jgi:hypothetical protein
MSTTTVSEFIMKSRGKQRRLSCSCTASATASSRGGDKGIESGLNKFYEAMMKTWKEKMGKK